MSDLRQAAQALLDRWDSPLWKNGSTADAIADLRAALAQQAEPVGSLSVRYYRGCKSMTNTDFDYTGDLPEGDYELYTAPPQQQAEPDRRDLQAAGTHPAPCARHCEAKAFEIEIRSLKSQLKQQAEPVAWTLTETLNKRETTTRGYLWFSNPQNYLWTPLYTTQPQRKPLTDELEAAFKEGWQSAKAAYGIKEGT